jgi:hypothetical protein
MWTAWSVIALSKEDDQQARAEPSTMLPSWAHADMHKVSARDDITVPAVLRPRWRERSVA